MRTLLTRYAVPFLVGVAGLFVGLMAVHAYNDHVVVHQIIVYLQQQQAAAKAAVPSAR